MERESPEVRHIAPPHKSDVNETKVQEVKEYSPVSDEEDGGLLLSSSKTLSFHL